MLIVKGVPILRRDFFKGVEKMFGKQTLYEIPN